LAFAFTIPTGAIIPIVLTQWIIKSAYEALATPFTYLVVNHLKRSEDVDVYDRDTSFNPLPFGR
jgi:uncharacterized PurR-regulated membrane protein YhhQ (DUF165 family)